VGLHGLLACQDVLDFGSVQPVAPDDFCVGQHLHFANALEQAMGQEGSRIVRHHLQGCVGVPLDAALECLAKSERQQHRQRHHEGAEHPGNLGAQAAPRDERGEGVQWHR